MELLLLLVLDPHLSGSSWFEEDPATPQMHVVGGRVLIPKAKPLVRPLLLLLLLLLVTAVTGNGMITARLRQPHFVK